MTSEATDDREATAEVPAPERGEHPGDDQAAPADDQAAPAEDQADDPAVHAYRAALDMLETFPQFVLANALLAARRHPAALWFIRLLRLDFTGISVGTLFYCWSLTPSLLPRDWLFQGLVGGITWALGYAAGVALGWLLDRYYLQHQRWWPLPRPIKLWLQTLVVVAIVVAVPVMLTQSARWQRELAGLMGIEGSATPGYLRTAIIAALVAAAAIAGWRVLADLVKFVARTLKRLLRIPDGLARLAGLVIVAASVAALFDGVLLRGAVSVIDTLSISTSHGNRPGVVSPTRPERSGSPESVAAWDTLGYEGRRFAAGGLHAEQLASLSGRPSKEPVRVYVGVESAPTAEERMALVTRELERTGAFDRRAVFVIPTTGTGWVNSTTARAIDLMYDGDVAVVAAQYSYLPSAASFLLDRAAAAEAGRQLVDTVIAARSARPAGKRSKLYVYGESLGTQAGEGAFADMADIRAKVDGVLWVGPPNSNRIWRTYVDRRDPGTTEADPAYANGLFLRFATSGSEVRRARGPWMTPRVLYIQHASDPVVWWDTRLIFERPNWLEEPPGRDRLPSMRWFPIVTFWQVSADLANAAGVPDGHGHNYGDAVLDGLVSIAAPERWAPFDTERVRLALHATADVDGQEK